MEHLTVLQAVVAERADGGVTVRRIPVLASEDCYDAATAERLGLTLDGGVWSRDLTDEMIAADLAKAGIEWVTWRRVDDSEIPDRQFRDAWTVDGGAIVHDMEKARAIHRDRMRAARAPLLQALDVAYQRADERGDAEGKAEVVTRKQALRDVTADPAIAAAATPDALKAVWPQILSD